jgi:hypothetical protein
VRAECPLGAQNFLAPRSLAVGSKESELSDLTDVYTSGTSLPLIAALEHTHVQSEQKVQSPQHAPPLQRKHAGVPRRATRRRALQQPPEKSMADILRPSIKCCFEFLFESCTEATMMSWLGERLHGRSFTTRVPWSAEQPRDWSANCIYEFLLLFLLSAPRSRVACARFFLLNQLLYHGIFCYAIFSDWIVAEQIVAGSFGQSEI